MVPLTYKESQFCPLVLRGPRFADGPPYKLTQVQQMKLPITRMNIAKDNIHDLIQKDIKFKNKKKSYKKWKRRQEATITYSYSNLRLLN